MDIIDVIREQEADDAFLLREELKDMANFVRIGKRIVNLDNVTEMRYQHNGGMSGNKPCVIISYVGDTDSYSAVYKEDEPRAFAQLMAWMGAQPALLPAIDVEPGGDES